ncbi:MAG: hypothetical protein AAF298_08320 [Cyanobacteria bacterium P01_A01_bin.40]
MTKHYRAYSVIKQKTSETNSPQNSFDLAKVEWVEVAPNKTIVATPKKTYLIAPNTDKCSSLHKFFRDRPTNLIKGASNVATTRKLLDGVIAAAKYGVNLDIRPPALTANRWVWRLAGAYHLTHLVPCLLEKAAQGFALTDRFILAQWAREKAKEETDHDLLALQDIHALGYDAEAVVKIFVPPAAKALMDYFTRSVGDDDPINCVGYSYTMERLAMGVDEEYIQKVEVLLPSNINATRCLRVHSSVGADAEHIEETVEMIAKLTAKERDRIIRACYETALMCFRTPSGGYINDELLRPILNQLKLDKTL